MNQIGEFLCQHVGCQLADSELTDRLLASWRRGFTSFAGFTDFPKVCKSLEGHAFPVVHDEKGGLFGREIGCEVNPYLASPSIVRICDQFFKCLVW